MCKFLITCELNISITTNLLHEYIFDITIKLLETFRFKNKYLKSNQIQDFFINLHLPTMFDTRILIIIAQIQIF